MENGGRWTSRIKEYAAERRQTPKNTATATPCGDSKGMSKRKICETHGIQRYVTDIKIANNIGECKQISQHTIWHTLHGNKFLSPAVIRQGGKDDYMINKYKINIFLAVKAD